MSSMNGVRADLSAVYRAHHCSLLAAMLAFAAILKVSGTKRHSDNGRPLTIVVLAAFSSSPLTVIQHRRRENAGCHLVSSDRIHRYTRRPCSDSRSPDAPCSSNVGSDV